MFAKMETTKRVNCNNFLVSKTRIYEMPEGIEVGEEPLFATK